MFDLTLKLLRDRGVLVVEDDSVLAADLTSLLERAGAIVLGPISTVAGAERIASDPRAIDGALLAVSLRGEMAWSVADRFAARRTPFVFVTGYDGVCIPCRHSTVPCFTKPVMIAPAIKALLGQMRRLT